MRLNSLIKYVPVLILFLHFCPALFAQSSTGRQEAFPRLEPDPKALEYSRRGARGYSWEDLAEISLWASGGNMSPYLEQIRAAAASIGRAAELPATDREKGEFILEYMHKNILKSYSLYQSGVDTMLSTGRYNCVSSAVLYMVLCESAGLDVSGVITRDHAFALLHLGAESVDVETTNPYGFDPGNRREFHDDFGRLTGFAYVPARNYRDRQTITPIELVSLIVSNRIAELETRNRFSEAIPLAVDRAALLSLIASDAGAPDPLFGNPKDDLLDRLLNYGATLLNSGREEDCLRWAAFASARYPPERSSDETRWQEHIMAAVNNRIVKFTRAGSFTEARNFLDAQRSALSAVNYAELDAILRTNRATDFHNRFAAAWNRRNYDEAMRILDEGLAEFPGDRQLLSDREIANRNR
jgi:hypothetical protein